MEQSKLISFAIDFVSFLLKDNSVKESVERIILFGSIARGDFDKESDVDLFIETTRKDKKTIDSIQKRLGLFNKSKKAEDWRLLGIKNEIRIKGGKLEDWKSLRRSIIIDGITLYGKYEGVPEKIKQFTLFTLKLGKVSRNKKMSIWRRLYGYNQKVGEKIYESEGMVDELSGKKLGRGLFMIPAEHSKKMIDFLEKERLNYSILELWRD